MKSNTKSSAMSSAIPSGVYDVETIKAECERFGFENTRTNIRRMRRAIDLHEAGAVKPSSAKGIYTVSSQTESPVDAVKCGKDMIAAGMLSQSHGSRTVTDRRSVQAAAKISDWLYASLIETLSGN